VAKRDGGRRPGWSTAAQDVVNRLFVYGTLRTGQTARSLIGEHVVDAEPATMIGRLWAFPDGYPGFLPDGDRPVIGELVTLGDLASAFPLLDAYEGTDFERTLQRARLADGTVHWAWVYCIANRDTVAQGEPIDGGDWVAFLASDRRRQASGGDPDPDPEA
jgi:gamma-glutamylcyclotransferase (GGCT)/AIG2-like uncharacterized protein YtfP